MRLFILFAFLVLSLSSVFAQGGIRGNVFNEKTKEPVIMATVALAGTKYGITTDLNGFFNISNIPAGEYRLVVKSVGFDTLSRKITIADRTVFLQLSIMERSKQLKQLDVNARKQLSRTKVNISTVNITSKEISKLPSIGGESDIAQYLQVVPGVVSSGDQGGQVYIRGGTPVMTKFLLDGMTVYNPFHSIGFFSTYETEIVKNVDIYTGGFNAKYGNRVSAVVDVTTRDGNKKEFQGRISMNPWASKLIVEGPIIKAKDGASGGLSYILSGKYSYLDRTSKVFYPYISGNLPYTFGDLYGKINYTSDQGIKLNLFGFNFTDRANFLGLADFNWRNYGMGGNAVIVPQNANMMINLRANYSSYTLQLIEEKSKTKSSSVGGFEVGIDFTSFLKKGELKYGLEISGAETEFQFTNRFFEKQPATVRFTSDFGLFGVLTQRFGPLVIEPSVRFQYYGSIQEPVIEPRLGMKLNASDHIRIKLSTGMYSQNLISTKSDRDIVNLYNGYIAGAKETLISPDGTTATSNLQRSLHFITGIEIDPAKNWTINIEPYYIYYPQVININRKKVTVADPNFMIETGKSYGVDLSVRYDTKRANIWANYSLSKTTRRDTADYPTHYDRTHNVNVLTSFTLGKKYDWEVSLRWNLGSGFPFTKTQGFYEELKNPADINNPYTNANGTVGVIYDKEINGGRLPYFHRLDFSAKKTFTISEKAKVEVSMSVINSYNRDNVFYFDRVQYKRVNQLPIIPSIGVSAIF
jgi:hypothetical protein